MPSIAATRCRFTRRHRAVDAVAYGFYAIYISTVYYYAMPCCRCRAMIDALFFHFADAARLRLYYLMLYAAMPRR